MVALDRPHQVPLHRTVSALVYASRGSDVELTVVDGRVVFEDGRCLLVDEDALLAEAQERSGQLVTRAGFGELTRPWNH